jgi:hypothetical protein
VRLLALVLILLPAGARAQVAAGQLHLGGGLYPGTGVFATGIQPHFQAITTEGALYADYQPRVLGGRGRLLVAAGAGGSLRLLRILSIARGSEVLPGVDVDVGARLGPAFYYAFFEQTAEAEARAFRIMFDPFARLIVPVAGRRAFVEVGGQGPQLRVGVAL